MAVCEELGCSKVCAQWVSQMLTDAHKEARTEIATDLFSYDKESEGFLSQIVTGVGGRGNES
jgi:hypothetical protein